MDFDSYQQWTATTSIYEDLDYPLLGLAEECGELLGKFAKWKRDETEFPEESVLKEAGDVLWMLARVLDDCGISLEEAALANMEKLESRKARNVLTGSGDNR